MTLNLSNNFSSASLPVVTEDRIFKDNFLQKFNEFIGKISCHESFDCAWYILRILGLRQSCLYNLRIKTKWLKLKYFVHLKKREGLGQIILKGKIDGKKEEEDWEGSRKGTYGMFSTFPREKLEYWQKLFLLCGQGCTTYDDKQLKQ